MKQTEIAWAAGFFDGEGCIAYRTSTGEHYQLRIHQKNPEPLYRFRRIFGLGNIIKENRIKTPNGKAAEIYLYLASGANAAIVISLMLPYLTLKREKAEALIKSRYEVQQYARQTFTYNKRKPTLDKERLNEIVTFKHNGYSFAAIGKALNISRQRAHQLYWLARNINQLKNKNSLW